MSSPMLEFEVAADAAQSARRVRKVLHLVNGEYYAGAERVQDLLALHLAQFDFEAGFVCVKPDRFARFRQSQDTPLWEVPLRHPWQRSVGRRITKIIRDEGFELIHSHTPRSAWAASMAARHTGLPWVHTQHDVALDDCSTPVRAAFNRFTVGRLRRADAAIAVSPATLDILARHRVGAVRCMVRNGVPGVGQLPRRKTPNRWTIGTVSLFRPGKGIDVLIRAMHRLAVRNCDARLLVVGRFVSEEFERETTSLIDSLGVGDRIELAGFSDDVPAQLRKMDLFVLPSTIAEGLPMVVLEAMAHGVPIVGSNVAGIADVVRDGVDGRLFAASDEKDLADVLDEFAQNRHDWQQMRRDVWNRHAAEFTAQRMSQETADVYRRVCGG